MSQRTHGMNEHSIRKRAPWGAVLRDQPVEERVAEVDWSQWYLDEDDMVESYEQGAIIRLLVSSLEELARLRSWDKVVFGADNYFAWVKDEPLVRVSPDVYMVENPPPPPLPAGWQTWLSGHQAPSWALEIVSPDWKKDYEQGPAKYAQLGCRELVIFDPDVVRGVVRNSARVPLTLYRRGEDGLFVKIHSGDGPAYSSELQVWLHVRLEGAVARLRLGFDDAGNRLVPTAAERAEAECLAREAEAKARKEAEERVRELEARLRKFEGPGRD